MPIVKPLLLAVLAALLATTTASAGTYTVHSCKTPSGVWVGADGWEVSSDPPVADVGGSVSTCSAADAPLQLQYGGIHPIGVGSWIDATFTAPSSTRIVSLSLLRAFNLAWPVAPSSADRAYIFQAWHGGDSNRRVLYLETPDRGEVLAELVPGIVERSGDWDSLTLSLRCWGVRGDFDCGPFPAHLAIPRAAMQLADETPPRLAFDSALSTARGRASYPFSASDSGGGVYRAVLRVDGVEVSRRVIDDDDGRCGDVESGNADAYEFAAPQPCPLSADSDVSFDTGTLVDGQHTVQLGVEDAAGNITFADAHTITTHNAPISTVAPSISGDARVGGLLTAATGQWDGAPTGFDHRWLRCDAAGAGCTTIAGAASASYAPTATDVGHRLLAEVAAANASGAATARSATSPVVADPAAGDPPPARGRDTTDPVDPGGDGAGRRAGDPPGGGQDGGGRDAARSPPPSDDGRGGDGGPRLRNPLAEEGGRAHNGSGTAAQARLRVELRLANGRAAQRVRSARGRSWLVSGRLTEPGGSAIAGARLNLVTKVPGRRWEADGVVVTGADGRFSKRLAPGASRSVRFTWFPFADSTRFRSSNAVTIDVLAPLTLAASRSAIASRGVVGLSGRVGGEQVPAGGLLVTLQGYQPGFGWRTFRSVRTSRRGTWRTSYRFLASSGRFAFRATVPRQGSYPYLTPTTKPVWVTVG